MDWLRRLFWRDEQRTTVRDEEIVTEGQRGAGTPAAGPIYGTNDADSGSSDAGGSDAGGGGFDAGGADAGGG